MKLRLEPKLHAAVSHFVSQVAKLIDEQGLEKPPVSGYYDDNQRVVVDKDFFIQIDKLHTGNALHLGQSEYPTNAIYAMYNCYRVLDRMCAVYSDSNVATLLPRLLKMRPEIELMMREFAYLAQTSLRSSYFQSMWVVDEKTRQLAEHYQQMFAELKKIEDQSRIINPAALKIILKAVQFEGELDFSSDKVILELLGYEPLHNSLRFYDCVQQYKTIIGLVSADDPAYHSINRFYEGEYESWKIMRDLEEKINTLFGLNDDQEIYSSRALLIKEQTRSIVDTLIAFNEQSDDAPNRAEQASALLENLAQFERELAKISQIVNIEHTSGQVSADSKEANQLLGAIEQSYQFSNLPVIRTRDDELPDRLSAKNYLLSKIDLLSGQLLNQVQQQLNEHSAQLKLYAEQHGINVAKPEDDIKSLSLEQSIQAQAKLIEQKDALNQKIVSNDKALNEQKRQLQKYEKPDRAIRKTLPKQALKDTVTICKMNIEDLQREQEKLSDQMYQINGQIAQFTPHIKEKSAEQIKAQRHADRSTFSQIMKVRLNSYKIERHKHYRFFDFLQKIFSFGKQTQQQLRETYVDELIQRLDQFAQNGKRKDLSVKLQYGLATFKPRRKHEKSLQHLVNEINQLTP